MNKNNYDIETNFAEPEVIPIAFTILNSNGSGRTFIEEEMSLDTSATDAENLTEFAGRACYQSFHKPNPETQANADYIARTLHKQGHFSIAEHATATFYITGVSRALTHELIRHRHLSYSELSQRFVKPEKTRFVVPPLAGDIGYEVESLSDAFATNKIYYHDSVETLRYRRREVTAKQVREAARAYLPNMTETKIVVTGNMRAWYEMINRRIQPDADAEFQRLSRLLLTELMEIAPSIFKPLAYFLED